MRHIMINYNPILDKKILNYTILILIFFVLSLNTIDIIKDSKNFEDIFDFSYLDEIHELFSNKKEKVFGKFKIETPKKILHR